MIQGFIGFVLGNILNLLSYRDDLQALKLLQSVGFFLFAAIMIVLVFRVLLGILGTPNGVVVFFLGLTGSLACGAIVRWLVMPAKKKE